MGMNCGRNGVASRLDLVLHELGNSRAKNGPWWTAGTCGTSYYGNLECMRGSHGDKDGCKQ